MTRPHIVTRRSSMNESNLVIRRRPRYVACHLSLVLRSIRATQCFGVSGVAGLSGDDATGA